MKITQRPLAEASRDLLDADFRYGHIISAFDEITIESIWAKPGDVIVTL